MLLYFTLKLLQIIQMEDKKILMNEQRERAERIKAHARRLLEHAEKLENGEEINE